MKRIILCADDYGQNTAISQAIIELIEKNRLSATSCMTNSPDWSSHAQWLQPLKDKADIGLHLNLTEGMPLSKNMQFMPLKELIIKAYSNQLDRDAIEIEFNSQLDQFEAGIGQKPDFIDGHQHIHQLPVIRDILIKIYADRLKNTHCYIRSVKDSMIFYRPLNPAYLKILAIQLLGAFAFQKLLDEHSIPYNTSFSGIYHFSQAKQYAKIFPKFLSKIGNKGIIMCHPGLAESKKENDSIADARYFEYQYFLSEQFLRDCDSKNVIINNKKLE